MDGKKTSAAAVSATDLLSALRGVEQRLRSAAVQQHVKAQADAEAGRKFAAARQELSALVGRLTDAELDALAGPAAGLAGELAAATARLDRQLTCLRRVAGILQGLDAVLGLAARLAVVAAA
ncbi:MAG: hypothetical protein WC708_17830 [Lentisphaeria bacterium]